MAHMRAKMMISSIIDNKYGDDKVTSQTLRMTCVARKDGYPSDGKDENNSFSRWSPYGEFMINITNPDLIGTFKSGDAYYVDFTKVE